MLGSVDDFFAASKPKTDDVPIPGVGKYRVRGLTVDEYKQYSQASLKVDGKGKATFEADLAKLVQLGAIKDDGSRLFALGDLAKLRGVSVTILRPLAEAIGRLNGEVRGDDLGNSPGTTASEPSSD